MKDRRALLLAATFSFAVGCGSSEAVIEAGNDGVEELPTDGPPSLDSINGVRTVFGADDPRVQLTHVEAITVDGEGRVFALDAVLQTILVFSQNGTLEETLGGKGQGPGEFLGGAGLTFDRDQQLWVWDVGNQRFTVFGPDLRLVTTHQRIVRGQLFPWRGRFLPDGRLVDWDVVRTEADMARTMILPTALSRGDLSRAETLPGIVFTRQLRSNRRTGVPYGPGISIYLADDGLVWFAHTRTYELIVRRLDGDTLRRIKIPARPRAVTPAERDSVVAESHRFSPGLHLTPDEIPRTKPIIKRILGDDAGRIYVLPELEDHPAGSVVDVFENEGTYLGRLRLPDQIETTTPPPWATREALYYVTHSELGVPQIVRLSLNW